MEDKNTFDVFKLQHFTHPKSNIINRSFFACLTILFEFFNIVTFYWHTLYFIFFQVMSGRSYKVSIGQALLRLVYYAGTVNVSPTMLAYTDDSNERDQVYIGELEGFNARIAHVSEIFFLKDFSLEIIAWHYNYV